jgi:hypothetical protein
MALGFSLPPITFAVFSTTFAGAVAALNPVVATLPAVLATLLKKFCACERGVPRASRAEMVSTVLQFMDGLIEDCVELKIQHMLYTSNPRSISL